MSDAKELTCERCGCTLAGIPVTLCADCEDGLTNSSAVQWALAILDEELRTRRMLPSSIEHAAELIRGVLKANG